MNVLVASVDETMSQMYLCDEDMDDDDLDPPITMQSIMNIKCEFEGGELTAPQAMAMMLDTHRSAMMVGKIILGGPKVTSVDDFHAGQWYELTKFERHHFTVMVQLHMKLPHQFRSTVSRHWCSREIGIMIMILRWRGHDWKGIESITNIRRNEASNLYHTAIDAYKATDYVVLALNVDIMRVTPRICEYQEACCAAGSTHPGMVCCADGKPMPGCRPSHRAAKKRGYDYKDDIQRVFYNGHYAAHGLKMSHHIWADGIVQVNVGSISEADQKLMDRTSLDSVLRYIGENRIACGAIAPTCYTDPAYTATDQIHRKHKGAITAEEKEDNCNMIRPRSAAEDTFKDFVNLFPYFDDRKKHMILTNGRATYADEIIVATVFYNLHTCFYSNQGAGLYYCAPPSALEYMQNCNMEPCGIPDIAIR